MMEGERSVVKTPSMTKEARAFNAIAMNNTVQGMKTASIFEKQVREAEIARAEAIKNEVEQEIPIPTGNEIREDIENGEYR